jgi:transketolase
LFNQTIEQKAINTIRTLSIDAIEKANSGHPGLPMGAAPMALKLWADHMNFNPDHPSWINRDRFVLSAGHGSMLLYSLLHLCGFDLPLEELKNFRQWNSLTPGHPEFGHTAGVDATTGPLGQGIGMAVGMAMAEAQLAGTYNKPEFKLMDHYTYVICGDGDLMEGISGESASLAGHLQLGKLIMLYDSNDISLDGELNLSFSEDIQKRFEGYGWEVLRVEDGNDLAAISTSIEKAKENSKQPTLIEVKTIIGFGSPNKGGKGGHGGPHGSPLGKEETLLTKEAYGWPSEPDFLVPDEVKDYFAEIKQKGIAKEAEWKQLFDSYKTAHPELAKQFEDAVAGKLPKGWDSDLPLYTPEDKALATRASSGAALNAIASKVLNLVGGSADLESSTNTHMKGIEVFNRNQYAGRNMYFGVREFAMAAAANGMALHGGLRPYVGTFFVFSDYLRPAVRLSAIQGLPVIYVFTHDSIAVGEDGPTHEPIEQLAALRVIPGVTVIRPADGNETTAAWHYAVNNKKGPVALVLTRQGLPNLPGTRDKAFGGIERGAYVLSDPSQGQIQAQIIATGSEVSLAMEAQKKLVEEGIHVRVISMPSWENFEKQSQDYKDSIIHPGVKARLAIEMAHPMGWDKYVGPEGQILAINHFGASAPGGKLAEEFGFTADNVAAKVKSIL